MAKDPAFLFYPGDWIGGTMYLTHEQKGCYMDLLILQFNTGKFTEAQAKQVLSICFSVAWATLKQKFKTDGTFFWNERLRKEIEKRQNFSKSRRDNALSKKNKPKNKKAYAKHMENENINENEDRNRIKNWDSIKKNFLNDFSWQEKFSKDKKIGPHALVDKMHEFLSDVELKEDFKTLKELKSHFTNLFNKNGKQFNSHKPGTSETRVAAVKDF